MSYLIAQVKRTKWDNNFNVYRELSKTTYVNLVWRASKATSTPIFEGTASSWDIHKLQLIFWLHRYDNIRESYNAPPEDIIRDNQALDAWLEEEGSRIDQDRVGNYYANRGMKSATQHENIISIFGDETPYGSGG